VSLEAFRNKAQSEYTLGGDYRKVVEKPGNFEWKVRMYEREKNERLVESDVDVLVRKEEEEEGREGGREGLPMYWKRFAKELRREEEGEGAGEGGGEGGGEKGSRALVVSFTLPPSTYATMLLRELLKVSMTTQEMKKLNDPPSLPASLPSAKAVLMEVEEEGGKEGGEEEGEGEGKEEQAQEA
jgi:tRNA(Glu) U13 pseudouridine synthase TruD